MKITETLIKTLAITLLVAGLVGWGIDIYFSIDDHKDYTSKFERYGHSYILVHASGANAITHDPDCPCHNNTPAATCKDE